jgi:hypothetical protein
MPELAKKKSKCRQSFAVSRTFAIIILVAALIVASLATVETLRLQTTSPSTSSTHSTSTATSRIITSFSSTFSTSTTASSSSSSSSYSSLNSGTPNIVYIATDNSPDSFGETSIYSTLDTNTGQLGWIFDTAQGDSVYTVSNNQLFQIRNNFHDSPLGITFDSKNNLAYITYAIPGGPPSGISAISGNRVVNTNLSLKSSPQDVVYDPRYDYLYVSVEPFPMSMQAQMGIAIFNPNNGEQLGYIPLNDGPPRAFAYASNNGNMFAAVYVFGGADHPSFTTIYELSGLSLDLTFNLTAIDARSMVYNSSNGYLYIANSGGNIYVVNSSSQDVVGTISTSATAVMVYDTLSGNVYAFEPGEMLMISGTTVISTTTTSDTVVSAVYDAPVQ